MAMIEGQVILELYKQIRQGQKDITVGGRLLTIGDCIAKGGSKSVFSLDDKTVIMLPNPIGEWGKDGWSSLVQNETERLNFYRQLGLFAQESKAVTISFKGIEGQVLTIPAIVAPSHHYLAEQNSMLIIDAKSNLPDDQIKFCRITLDTILQSENIEKFLTGFMSDIAILVANGLEISGDSFNLCIDSSGQLRLFIYDVASKGEKSGVDLPTVTKEYTAMTILSLVMMEKEYQIDYLKHQYIAMNSKIKLKYIEEALTTFVCSLVNSGCFKLSQDDDVYLIKSKCFDSFYTKSDALLSIMWSKVRTLIETRCSSTADSQATCARLACRQFDLYRAKLVESSDKMRYEVWVHKFREANPRAEERGFGPGALVTNGTSC